MKNLMTSKSDPPSDVKIGIVGLGYVGLTTAVGFAHLGLNVTGTDSDPNRVANLNEGIAYINEPRLQDLLNEGLHSGRLRFHGSNESIIQNADVVFVCVGTPQSKSGDPDLSQIDQAVISIGKNIRKYTVIVMKSTVPVGTSMRVHQTLSQICKDQSHFDVVSNPEFLREGFAIEDFLKPTRVVIGVDSLNACKLLKDIYSHLGRPILITNSNTAEVIKHASNSFLATKISFINMISDLCESSGADVYTVSEAMGMDPRIGPQYLSAGIGYGGSCLPKDIKALIHSGNLHKVDMSILESVDRINKSRIENLVDKLEQVIGSLAGKKIAVLGLAFKPGTDDVRESPSLKTIQTLLSRSSSVRLHDPIAIEATKILIPEQPESVEYFSTVEEAVRGTEAQLVLTAWPEYQDYDLDFLKNLVKSTVLVDGTNMFDPKKVTESGFRYVSIGRMNPNPLS